MYAFDQIPAEYTEARRYNQLIKEKLYKRMIEVEDNLAKWVTIAETICKSSAQIEECELVYMYNFIQEKLDSRYKDGLEYYIADDMISIRKLIDKRLHKE